MISCHNLWAQPFRCTGDLILTVAPEATESRFYTIDIQNNPEPQIIFNEFSTEPTPYINAIGYRRVDNYVYGIAPNTRDLYRIDANGNATFLSSIEELNPSNNYNAGDVSPDGQFLVLLSGRATSFPWRNVELILIDLQSNDYNTAVIPIITLSGEVVYSLDIAFDPLTGQLYGYDGHAGRLLLIQLSSGEINDLAFQATGTINAMASLFFDSFGNLYGYAKHLGEQGIKAFYKIDKNSGALEFVLEGPLASASDGCSCPYRIELLKSVQPSETVSCSEVLYTFSLANATNAIQENIRFEDIFPPGFEVLEITGNTYNGQIQGLNTGTLIIDNMSVSPGIDSFQVRVAIGDIPPGVYANQASLNNLSIAIGSTELSDDPTTILLDDPTNLEVLPLEVIPEDQLLDLCPGDTLLIDASLPEGIFEYTWEDGSNNPLRPVFESGIYTILIENECETFEVIYIVEAINPDLELDLGADLEVNLGESILIHPSISGTASIYYNWNSNNDQTLSCTNCPVLEVIPTDDATYTLTILDDNGCSQSDAINVFVNKDYKIFVPNIFTPNGDGINDRFFIQGQENIKIKSFRIFDRWGSLVYAKNNVPVSDETAGWDGYIKDKKAPTAVFVWLAEVEFIDGKQKKFSGDVAVVY